jgi:hypothetical protein
MQLSANWLTNHATFLHPLLQLEDEELMIDCLEIKLNHHQLKMNSDFD